MISIEILSVVPVELKKSSMQRFDSLRFVVLKSSEVPDVAIVKISSQLSLPKPPVTTSYGHLKSVRSYTFDELYSAYTSRVKMIGRSSGLQQDLILEYPASFYFKYPDNPQGFLLNQLFTTSNQARSDDSGVLLVD
ncbi:hypothetical protein ACFL27_25875 [candidate division CSSED10-310 bacterium]|uniref:Uncharacterized protein n=1 Tax=candidate division CSSED10-310 bacterium TaxID=2855610 RepID=A0ABV6Z5A4_UNCC1